MQWKPDGGVKSDTDRFIQQECENALVLRNQGKIKQSAGKWEYIVNHILRLPKNCITKVQWRGMDQALTNLAQIALELRSVSMGKTAIARVVRKVVSSCNFLNCVQEVGKIRVV